MSSPISWPELQPLAARIAVGELDGDEALDAIVDAIVRSHGGDISVESDHMEGSTFTVILPLHQGTG